MPDTGLSREPTVFRAKIAIIGEGYVGATFRVRASVRAGTMDVAVGSDILVIAADPNQLATAAGVSFDGADRDRIAAEVRGAAYEIIEGKARPITPSLPDWSASSRRFSGDQRSLLTVSNAVGAGGYPADIEGVWLSMPRIVGRGGILLSPAADLAPEDLAGLASSAGILRAAWAGIH